MKMWSKPPSRLEVLLRSLRSLAAAALVVLVAAPAAVSSAPPAEPKTLAELLPLVQATYKGVTAIRSDFVQSAKNPATGVEFKESGRILLERPRKYRMEMGLPLTTALVSDGTTQWVYSAPAKQVTMQKELGTGAGPVQLIDDLGRLSELFDATLAPPTTPPKPFYVVSLKPKVAGAYKQIDLTLKKQTYTLQELVLTDVTGGVTKMTFNGMVLGGDIPDTQFTFKAPPGVTVVNQMQ